MDADSAKAEYESAEENTDITIPFTFTEPEITTEKMNANLFKDTLEVTAPAQQVERAEEFTTSDLRHLSATDRSFCREKPSLLMVS